jgi:hypothetical protein
MQVLATPEVFMPVKFYFTQFFYYVYLSNERVIPFNFIEQVLQIFKTLAQEFDSYASLSYSNTIFPGNIDEVMILTHEKYKPFNAWVAEYLLLLTDIFLNIIRKDLYFIPDSQPAYLFQDAIRVIKSAVQVAMDNYEDENLLHHWDELAKELVYVHLGHSNRNVDTSSGDTISELEPVDIDVESLKSDAVSVRNAKRKQTAQEQKPLDIFGKIESMIDFYFTTEKFQERCRQESYLLIENLKNISKMTAGKSVKISVIRVFQNVIHFLEQSMQEPEQDYMEIVLLSLGIFRKYIEMVSQASLHLTDLLLPHSENGQQYADIITERQNTLIQINIVPLICIIFENCKSNEIIKETLLLAITILSGGNPKSQQAFLDYFMLDSGNTFLKTLWNVKMNSFGVVTANMSQRNKITLKQYEVSHNPHLNQNTRLRREIQRDSMGERIRREIDEVSLHQEICKCIFRFLQLLCEGHNIHLQNFLRNQNDSNHNSSCNFIFSTTHCWARYIKIVNVDCYELGLLMLNFMIEAMQGPCCDNQAELYQNKMIDYSKDFMNAFMVKKDFESRGFTEDKRILLDELFSKNIFVLQSMLELNNSAEIIKEMGFSTDFHLLMDKLVGIFRHLFPGVTFEDNEQTHTVKSLTEGIVESVFHEEFAIAFNILFFLQTINEKTAIFEKKIQELAGIKLLAYQFLSFHSRRIEIIYREGIYFHFFIVQPSCSNFGKERKLNFIQEVRRGNYREKIIHFLSATGPMFDWMDHMYRLKTSMPFIPERIVTNLRDLCFYTAVLINAYLFLTHRKDVVLSAFETQRYLLDWVFIFVRQPLPRLSASSTWPSALSCSSCSLSSTAT